MSLRSRLIISFGYLLLLAVIALALPLAVNVERRARSEFEARLSTQASVIASSLGPALAADTFPDLGPAVDSYAADTGARVIVTDRTGRLIEDSDPVKGASPDYRSRPEIAAALEGKRLRITRHSRDLGRDLLLAAVPVREGSEIVGAVRLSETTADVERRLRVSRIAITSASAFVVAAGLLAAWALAASLARPLKRLQDAASALGAGDLSARAPESGPRDIREISATFNTMARDLQRTINAQRDFLADSSHQLRTPLTGLRLRLESIAARRGPASREAKAALAEVDRLGGLVNDLLALARAGAARDHGSPVSLVEAVHAAVDRFSAAAEARNQVLSAAPAADSLVVCDPGDVAMMLDNLIENAIVYSPEGAEITVSPLPSGFSVSDTGPGIPPEEAPRVLERFFRGRTGRASGPGTGLGLAIVRETAARWGGETKVLPGGPGTTVTVSFPS